ncbi:MAG TPA: protein translocase subunit SecF, partial [Nitrospirales bacterium]|nr:protein translocase subunit SecF [Nitrospirales bacterium]
MVEIVGKTNFDFMGKRKYTFMASGLMVFIGCIALFQIGWGTANLGIDFVGGTAVQLRFDNPMPIEEARAALVQGGLGEADLQEIVRENKLMIRVKESNTIEEEVADRIVKVFEDAF